MAKISWLDRFLRVEFSKYSVTGECVRLTITGCKDEGCCFGALIVRYKLYHKMNLL